MQYEMIDEVDKVEAASAGDFLRALLLLLGVVVLTSAVVYFAVAAIVALGMSGLQ